MKYSEYQKCEPRDGPLPPPLPPTDKDIEGPFYLPDAPFRNVLCDNPTLCLSGVVSDQHGQRISSVLLDFWQADANGKYDEKGFGFRGRQRASLGSYSLSTVRPGDYDISDPGDPQPHVFRCAHIHVKVSAPGFKPLTTQLYFPEDPFNATDKWFDQRRLIRYVGNEGRFDFVLEQE